MKLPPVPTKTHGARQTATSVQVGSEQGCQMVCFPTKNTNLGKFWRVLQWKLLVYFMAIWSFYENLVYFVAIWYLLWLFGIFFPVTPGKIWQPWIGGLVSCKICT
jgi:hypothetical protein